MRAPRLRASPRHGGAVRCLQICLQTLIRRWSAPLLCYPPGAIIPRKVLRYHRTTQGAVCGGQGLPPPIPGNLRYEELSGFQQGRFLHSFKGGRVRMCVSGWCRIIHVPHYRSGSIVPIPAMDGHVADRPGKGLITPADGLMARVNRDQPVYTRQE